MYPTSLLNSNCCPSPWLVSCRTSSASIRIVSASFRPQSPGFSSWFDPHIVTCLTSPYPDDRATLRGACKSKQPLLMYLLTQVHIRSRLFDRLFAPPIGDIVIMPRSWHLIIRNKGTPSGNLSPFCPVNIPLSRKNANAVVSSMALLCHTDSAYIVYKPRMH